LVDGKRRTGAQTHGLFFPSWTVNEAASTEGEKAYSQAPWFLSFHDLSLNDKPAVPMTNKLHQRSNKSSKSTADDESLREELTTLQADASSMSGRDASLIIKDCDSLHQRINASRTLPGGEKKKMLGKLKNIKTDIQFEEQMEKVCGKVCQRGLFFVMFFPMLITFLSSMTEFISRPAMLVKVADLKDGERFIVTGGCGAVGSELALKLAQSGAEVIAGCHDFEARKEVDDAVLRKFLAWKRPVHGDEDETGWIDVRPLNLESFASVRAFALHVSKLEGTRGVDVLVHTAATKEGCNTTVDGMEYNTQVNYLSPFLLTKLLLPSLVSGGKPSRVVYTTCAAGLQEADWMPWPLARTQESTLPKIDVVNIARGTTDRCNPLMQYANMKLAIVSHSHELNRRIRSRSKGKDFVSHVVDPGQMNNPHGIQPSVPEGRQSLRSNLLGYLPPVWLFRKIYEYVKTKMLRDTQVGVDALYHVATAPSLQRKGGGLFADTAGAFTNCDRSHPGLCGRVSRKEQPTAAVDEKLAKRLWRTTIKSLSNQLLPLKDGDVVESAVVEDEDGGEFAEEGNGATHYDIDEEEDDDDEDFGQEETN